ncbi:MAG: invasion associated locus B family protein [Hyphomicrobiaceae bacterium]|nr:invasion associated locus B family protein [Hyphomicrobiaceae bacterium]
MAHHDRRMLRAPRAALTLSASVALALGAIATGTPAFAQKKGEAKKEPPKAEAAAPAAGGEKQSAWVKLCETAKLPVPPKADAKPDDKPEVEEKKICLTHHERLDGNTGMVLVSAAVREVEGQDKKSLMIMVPLGMAIPPGVRAAVYTSDQWNKASKNEKIDDSQLKPINLKYSLCHPAGCTAEVEADAGLIDEMKKGGGLMVLALNAGAKPIGFPVPLDGFTKAYEGAPVNNEEYAKARGELMKQIRERQAKVVEKMKEEQKAKQDAAKLLDPPPGAAPAEKKK